MALWLLLDFRFEPCRSSFRSFQAICALLIIILTRALKSIATFAVGDWRYLAGSDIHLVANRPTLLNSYPIADWWLMNYLRSFVCSKVVVLFWVTCVLQGFSASLRSRSIFKKPYSSMRSQSPRSALCSSPIAPQVSQIALASVW